jgi:hypothetical protein
MRWAGHLAHKGEKRGACWVSVERPEERNHLEDSGIDGMIILTWILEKWVSGTWTGLIWLRTETGGRLL